MNAITYKEIFPLIKDDKLWLGVTRQGTGSMWFRIPDDAPIQTGQKEENGLRFQTIGNTAWFTNLDHSLRHEKIILYKNYSPDEYPQYDNYDAINVNKASEMPLDYDGIMGVPITFLGKYNPEQFEIVKFRKGNDDKDLSVNGKCPYFRILIRRRLQNEMPMAAEENPEYGK